MSAVKDSAGSMRENKNRWAGQVAGFADNVASGICGKVNDHSAGLLGEDTRMWRWWLVAIRDKWLRTERPRIVVPDIWPHLSNIESCTPKAERSWWMGHFLPVRGKGSPSFLKLMKAQQSRSSFPQNYDISLNIFLRSSSIYPLLTGLIPAKSFFFAGWSAKKAWKKYTSLWYTQPFILLHFFSFEISK